MKETRTLMSKEPRSIVDQMRLGSFMVFDGNITPWALFKPWGIGRTLFLTSLHPTLTTAPLPPLLLYPETLQHNGSLQLQLLLPSPLLYWPLPSRSNGQSTAQRVLRELRLGLQSTTSFVDV